MDVKVKDKSYLNISTFYKKLQLIKKLFQRKKVKIKNFMYTSKLTLS